MREILTIFACLVVAALSAALAAPYFIDWTAQRDLIEAQLGQITGARITTSGAIDLKLLPTPRLTLDGMESHATGLSLRSQKLTLELAIAPLMRGEFRFTEAVFERPEIEAQPGADGAIALPRPGDGLPEDVRFERIILRDGSVRIAGAGDSASVRFQGLDLDAEAASLRGPFRGSGSVSAPGGKVAFRFTTGAIEDGRMRLKFVSDETSVLPRADLDGAVIFTREQSGRRLSFEGAAVFSGRDFAGWRVAGPLKLDAKGMNIEPLEAKIGGDDLAIGLDGASSVTFGATPIASATLRARQFDLDRLIGADAASASTLLSQPARWIADKDFAARAPLPWQVAFTTPALTLGGETLTDTSIVMSVTPGAPVALKLSANGPGRSRLAIDGAVETGSAARFSGRAEVGARDLARLADWIVQASPEAAARLRAIPFRSLEAAAETTFSAAGFSARELVLAADRSTMKGVAAFTRPLGGEPARLFADVTAEALDLDALPDLTSPAIALAGMDYSLALDAHAVRVARFGAGMIDSGRIRTKITRAGKDIRLENLALDNVGGASLEANGVMSESGARLAGRLDAERLGELAALVERIAPGQWSRAFATRATALSPARLAFSAEGERGADLPRISTLRLEGTARGTKIDATVRPDVIGRDLAGQLMLDAPDATMLVRQFGLETLPVTGAGRARLGAELHGNFETGFETKAQADIAGARLSYSGNLAGSPLAPRMSGRASAVSADAAPFLRVMAFSLPDFSTRLPIDLSTRIELADGKLTLPDIAGALAGAKIGGELAGSPDASAGNRLRLTGALTLDRASTPAFAVLLLGPPQPPRAGARWSDARFAAGLAETPFADVKLSIGELALTDTFVAREAKFTLSLAPGLMQADDISAKIGAATLSGRIALRRDGEAAGLSGALGIDGLAFDQRGIAGRIDGRAEFSTTGASPAALVAGLAGAGRATIGSLAIARADPGAPGRVIRASDANQIYVSENDFIGALRREFDQGGLALSTYASEITLAGGVLRLAETDGFSASFDLRNLSIDARASIVPAPLPRDWKGDAAPVILAWRGPLADPRREIEAGAFVSALSARAIAREQARVEALEADIRERAAFARRQRGLAFLRLREREIAAYEAEQIRLAAEAERKRLEEERRAAEEERRRQAEAERRKLEEARRAAEEERRRAAAEAARAERERRAAEARRPEAESNRETAVQPAPRQLVPPPLLPQPPLRLPVVPDARTDPSAAGRY